MFRAVCYVECVSCCLLGSVCSLLFVRFLFSFYQLVTDLVRSPFSVTSYIIKGNRFLS